MGREWRTFWKPSRRLAADALRGRVGRDELGVVGLEPLELVHERVVFGVGNFGRVEDVVEVLVVAQLMAQSFCASGR